MYKVSVAILLVLASFSHVHSAGTGLGAYFQICHQADSNLGECLRKSLTAAASAVVKGIPALGLPNLEPLNVPSIEMKDRYGLLSFQQTLTNFNIRGMTKYTIKSVDVDQAKGTVKLVINSPSIQLDGKYSMDVKILALPVRGSGDFTMKFTNVDSTIDIEIEKYNSGGVDRYRLKNLFWDVSPETAALSFSSLGDTVNRFVNANWRLAFNIYKRIPEEAFSSLIMDQINQVLAQHTADEIFPK